jgi:hypothetical protein
VHECPKFHAECIDEVPVLALLDSAAPVLKSSTIYRLRQGWPKKKVTHTCTAWYPWKIQIQNHTFAVRMSVALILLVVPDDQGKLHVLGSARVLRICSGNAQVMEPPTCSVALLRPGLVWTFTEWEKGRDKFPAGLQYMYLVYRVQLPFSGDGRLSGHAELASIRSEPSEIGICSGTRRKGEFNIPDFFPDFFMKGKF